MHYWYDCVNALTGLYLIATVIPEATIMAAVSVNALTGLYLIATRDMAYNDGKEILDVSMPSRAYTSLLHTIIVL